MIIGQTKTTNFSPIGPANRPFSCFVLIEQNPSTREPATSDFPEKNDNKTNDSP